MHCRAVIFTQFLKLFCRQDSYCTIYICLEQKFPQAFGNMWTLFFICTGTCCLELIFKECEFRLQCSQAEDNWSSSECWESSLDHWWWWFCWSQTEPELWGSSVGRWRCLWATKVKYTYACSSMHCRAVIFTQFLKLFCRQDSYCTIYICLEQKFPQAFGNMWTLFFICTGTCCLELIFKECEFRLHIQFMNTQFLFKYRYTLMLIWCWCQCLRHTWLSFRLYEDTLTYSCRAHTGLSKIGHWYCIVGMFTGTNLQSSMHIICVAIVPRPHAL